MKQLIAAFILLCVLSFGAGWILSRYFAPKQYGPIVYIDATKVQTGAVWLKCKNSEQSPNLDATAAAMHQYDAEKKVFALQFEACKP